MSKQEQKDFDPVIKELDPTIYQVIASHYLHVEQVRWSFTYSFLTANTIFLLGWAAIFASYAPPPLLLKSISFIGLVLCGIWLLYVRRGNAFVDTYYKLGLAAENALYPKARGIKGAFVGAQELRKKLQWSIPGNCVVQLIPCLFIAVYIALLLWGIPTIGQNR